MSIRSSPSAALRVDLRGSLRLCVAVAALAACGLWVIFASALPAILQLTLAGAVLARVIQLRRDQYALRGTLLWLDGNWRWVDAGGECSMQLYTATVWPGLIVLRMRAVGTRRIRIFALLADSVDRDAQRQLRVCLRHMPVFDAAWRGSRQNP